MSGRALVVAATISAVALQAVSMVAMSQAQLNSLRGWPKLLLWNGSASAPRGLYLLRPPEPLRRADFVVAMPAPWLGHFAASRGYLPEGVPLLKQIAALPPQIICRIRTAVTVDNRVVARAADKDHLGRQLPSWSGCRVLRLGQVFLLNRGVPGSFDGRYFGPLPASAISARAIPLWTEAVRPTSVMSTANSRFAGRSAFNQSPIMTPIPSLSSFAPSASAKLFSAHCAAAAAVPLSSAASGPATGPVQGNYDGFIDEAAGRFDIPRAWITAVMKVESNGDAQAVSPKGAMGLMQIMPSTWVELQRRYQLGADAFDPRDNILAGTGYLRELFERFGPEHFLAAYHTGPSRLEAVLKGETMLGPNTESYLRRVSRVLSNGPAKIAARTAAIANWATSALFLSTADRGPKTPEQRGVGTTFPLAPQDGGLFVAISPSDQ